MKLRYRIWDKKYNRWNTGRPSMDKLFILVDRTFCEFNSERYVLQTSTGKFDKNGVEIFEGDIIKYDYIDGCFSDGKLSERNQVKEVKPYLTTNFDAEFSGGPDGTFTYENIEVIGNIFKNPELI